MEEFRVRIRGRGRVEVAAYGIGDAEHLVEKEIGRLWPEAKVEIVEAARTASGQRLVEEFRIAYRLTAPLTVEAASRDEAPSAAYRHARGLLAGSRYEKTEWENAS